MNSVKIFRLIVCNAVIALLVALLVIFAHPTKSQSVVADESPIYKGSSSNKISGS